MQFFCNNSFMVNFPSAFVNNIIHTFGTVEGEALLHAMQGSPDISIRLNPFKCNEQTGGLQLEAPLAERVPWCSDGYYLSERPSFTDDPLFHAGHYYVQEASSMFLQCVMKQYVSHPCTMLDLCAAPGGKSTLARAALSEGSLLVSNDPVRKRALVLAENILKWGHPDCIVTNAFPDEYSALGSLFDVILCDVPCSGEGMFRKEPAAIEQWTEQYVATCAQRQRDIVSHAWQCLRPGGILIYSTCTLNTQENEDNIQWLIDTQGAQPLPVDINETWNIASSPINSFPHPVYRFLPHRTKGEGLFMAVVRKPEGDTPKPLSQKQQRPGRVKKTTFPLQQEMEACCRRWLTEADTFTVLPMNDESCSAMRTPFVPMLHLLRQHLTVLTAGITLAYRKGRNIIPHQALALSIQRLPQAFPACPVERQQAHAYLRTECLQLPPDVPKGIVLLTFRNAPLGFVNNLGTRANNLYPHEWRIRKNIYDNETLLTTPATHS